MNGKDSAAMAPGSEVSASSAMVRSPRRSAVESRPSSSILESERPADSALLRKVLRRIVNC